MLPRASIGMFHVTSLCDERSVKPTNFELIWFN